jgi:1-phosphofructokinase family hexose kinase
VLVVNPNLCFDRTLWVDELTVGTVSRPRRVDVTAGGKGVNVVRAVRDLGAECTLLALLPDRGSDRLEALLRSEGLTVVGVPVAGDVRSATIVVEDSGRATVLNEPGPVLDASDLDRLVDAVGSEFRAGHRVLACSGSLPPGLPVEAYARLVAAAREHGAVSVVDAARDALAAALPAGPDLVTPNLDEAEGLDTGRAVEEVAPTNGVDAVPERALEAAGMLLERGALRALVTAGEFGAAYADRSGRQWLEAPPAQVANPIGAGDALVAGVLAALEHGAEPDWLGAVTHGVRVASAAVEHPVAGRIDPDRARSLSAGLALGAG